MATSGSINFTMTAADIINRAFSLCGLKQESIPLEAQKLQTGIEHLNMLIKSQSANGIQLWTKTEAVLFLDAGKESYLLGANGDKSCREDDFIATELTADAAATATVLTVSSTTGMAASDNIGIELDDGTRQWTTIVSVDSSTQLTITAGLTSVASTSNSIFTYTTLLERPLEILQARRKKYGEDSEIEIYLISRERYFNQSDKSTEGVVTQAYYSPQLDDGILYVWGTSDSVKRYLTFTFKRTLQDIDSSTNNLDFPQEWLEALYK